MQNKPKAELTAALMLLDTAVCHLICGKSTTAALCSPRRRES